MKKLLSIRTFSLLIFVAMATSHRAWASDPMDFPFNSTPITEVQGTTQVFKSAGNPDHLSYVPRQVGDSITFELKLTQSGPYSVTALSYKTGTEGIYSMEIDGQEVSRHDYSLNNKWEVGRFNIVPDTYNFTFRCIGKNPKSSGLGVILDTLQFHPVS